MKTVEFFRTTTGYIAEVNKVSTWFIRHEPNEKPNNKWYVYKSKDGGKSHKLIQKVAKINQNGDCDTGSVWGFESLKAAKAFIYREEITA